MTNARLSLFATLRSTTALRGGLAMFLLAAAVPAAHPARANPLGGVVVEGQAVIVPVSPDRLDVRQTSPKAIIEWQDFSIGAGKHTHFQQPSKDAIALNRVVTANPSEIHGRLSATGQVWLVNPNGIFFGPSASVDVAGLVATTHDIRNADFMAGRYRFESNGALAGTVENHGSITAGDAGLVALVAPGVANHGIITARLGEVALASGRQFVVDLFGDQKINLALDQPITAPPVGRDGKPVAALVKNDGKIFADGGRVRMTAAAAKGVVDKVIDTSGYVQARTVEQRDGEIILSGGESGIVAVSGTLDASGPAAGARGGTVVVSGEKVGLMAGARVDVSGRAGGGTALIGGGVQGGKASAATLAGYGLVPARKPVAPAQFASIDPAATITADATEAGRGGTVVVWSEQTTRSAGTLSARGGPLGGDGGFIETSGRQRLQVGRPADASAPAGKAGVWLLDPTDVTISGSGPFVGGSWSGGLFDPVLADAATVDAGTINSALNAGTSVTIATSSPGLGSGDITITADGAIRKTAGGDAELRLVAQRNITINGSITSSSGALNLSLQAQTGTTTTIDADIDTNGGSVTVGTASMGPTFILKAGRSLTASNVFIAADDITIDGALSATGNAWLQGGIGKSFTQGSGGTITVGQGMTLSIAADRIALNGAVGSIRTTAAGRSATGSLSSVNLRPSQGSTTIGLGNGAGTFSLTQAELDTLSSFDDRYIGETWSTGATTIDGALILSGRTHIRGDSINFAAASSVTTTNNSALAFNGRQFTKPDGVTINVGTGNLEISTTGNSLPDLNGAAGQITAGSVSLILTAAYGSNVSIGTTGGDWVIGSAAFNDLATKLGADRTSITVNGDTYKTVTLGGSLVLPRGLTINGGAGIALNSDAALAGSTLSSVFFGADTVTQTSGASVTAGGQGQIEVRAKNGGFSLGGAANSLSAGLVVATIRSDSFASVGIGSGTGADVVSQTDLDTLAGQVSAVSGDAVRRIKVYAPNADINVGGTLSLGAVSQLELTNSASGRSINVADGTALSVGGAGYRTITASTNGTLTLGAGATLSTAGGSGSGPVELSATGFSIGGGATLSGTYGQLTLRPEFAWTNISMGTATGGYHVSQSMIDAAAALSGVTRVRIGDSAEATLTLGGTIDLPVDTTLRARDITINGAITSAGSRNLTLLTPGNGDIAIVGPLGSTSARLGQVQIADGAQDTASRPRNVTSSTLIAAGSFVQHQGTGTTSFGGSGLDTTGASSIRTNAIQGTVNVASLSIDSASSTLSGSFGAGVTYASTSGMHIENGKTVSPGTTVPSSTGGSSGGGAVDPAPTITPTTTLTSTPTGTTPATSSGAAQPTPAATAPAPTETPTQTALRNPAVTTALQAVATVDKGSTPAAVTADTVLSVPMVPGFVASAGSLPALPTPPAPGGASGTIGLNLSASGAAGAVERSLGSAVAQAATTPQVQEAVQLVRRSLETGSISAAIATIADNPQLSGVEQQAIFRSIPAAALVQGLLDSSDRVAVEVGTKLKDVLSSAGSSVASTGASTGARVTYGDVKTLLRDRGAESTVTKTYLAAFLAVQKEARTNLFSDALAELGSNPGAADLFGTPPTSGAAVTLADLAQPTLAQSGHAVIQGRIDGPVDSAEVRVDGKWVFVDDQGRFKAHLPVKTGANTLQVSVSSAQGEAGRRSLEVTAPQATPPQAGKGRRIALMFAVEKYQSPMIPTLSTPAEDVKLVGQALSTMLGYETRVVLNPTKAEIAETMRALGREIGENDQAVIYYAGHGYEVEKTGVGYWLPADAETQSARNWVSNADVARFLRRIPAKHIMMLSDSCYSGSFTKEQKVEGAPAVAAKRELLERRSVMAMSSGGDEPVMDGDVNSPFATALASNLKRLPSDADGADIYAKVRNTVTQDAPQTPQYGIVKSAGYDAGGDFLFNLRAQARSNPRNSRTAGR